MSEFPALGVQYSKASKRLFPMNEVQKGTRDEILASDTSDDFEQTVCYCGKTKDQVLSQIDRYGLPYRKVICMGCGLMRSNPRWTKERFTKFYSDEYRDLFNNPVEGKREFVKQLAENIRVKNFAEWIVRSNRSYKVFAKKEQLEVQTPIVLEIGCGGGWNLGALPKEWRRIGVDGDSSYLEIGKSLFGIETISGFLDEALVQIGNADLIILSHVVEHFLDPAAELKKISDLMHPGALLFIEVPGVFRIHKSCRNPMTYMQCAHVFTFTSATLEQVCLSAGLQPLEKSEEVRFVLRKAIDDNSNSRAGRTFIPSPCKSLGKNTLSYLQLCEFGYGVELRLRKLPFPLGKVFGLIWRKVYEFVPDLLYRAKIRK